MAATEIERLRQVLADLSDTLVSLRHQIDEARSLLETVSLASTTPESPSAGSRHQHESPRHSEMERRVKELETINRELIENMERFLSRHGRCEEEINRAETTRNGVMKKYRLLVRVAAELLQRVKQEFSDEEFDDLTRNAVEVDLKRVYATDASPSSSSDTARPRFEGIPRYPGVPSRSPEGHGSRTGVSSVTPGTGYTSSADTQFSTFADSPAVGPDGLLLEWKIHTGSKCPASVNVTAGPFTQRDFVKLGIDKTRLEDILYSLTHSNDVEIRIASPSEPLSLPGLPDVKLVFLYDPWYLESGLGTYILDWATPLKHQTIKNWLRNSSDGDEDPVFHTFTFSKKKGQWYYFGGLRWSLPSDSQPIWPTLVDDAENSSRATILQHLSERSHGRVAPGAIEQKIGSGELEEVSMNITPVDEAGIMEEIALRLGKRLKTMKPFVVRGDQ